jgi:hypothetical protein
MKHPKGLHSWYLKTRNALDKDYPPQDEVLYKQNPQFNKLSNWALVCEEILDTEPTPGILTKFYEELIGRGLSNSDIQEMREFAWLTAGWLNYSKGMWEWVKLDEADIQSAIDMQFQESLISQKEKDIFISVLNKYNGFKISR